MSAYREISDFFLTGRNTFKSLGIDVNAAENKAVLRNKFIFVIMFISSLVIAIMMLAYAICNIKDMDKVASGLWFFVPWLLGTFKTLVFLKQARSYLRLMRRFEQYTMTSGIYEYEIVKKELLLGEAFCKIYKLTTYCGIICLTSKPLVLTLHRYMTTGILIWAPPFAGVFPYDYQEPAFYIFSYMLYFVFLNYISYCCVNVDALFLYYVQYISGFYSILFKKWQQLAEQLLDDGTSQHFVTKLIEAVCLHRTIIRLTANLNALFSLIIFIEVILSCFQMCMFLYKLSNKEPEYLTAAIALSVCVLQLMIYCLGGQRIENQSDLLRMKLYLLFPWYRMQRCHTHLMILPLERAQVLQTVNGFLFTVRSNLLVSIFRMSFSITALLKAMNENAK